MMLDILLVVVCLVSMSLSAMAITLKEGRHTATFVRRKRTANDSVMVGAVGCI